MENNIFINLIGYQILTLNNEGFSVCKGNDVKHFIFIEDEGDCCGCNSLETKLLINPQDIANNPVISRVEYDYCDDYDHDENNVVITFFGVEKTLAIIDSCSTSGSGYQYGACVSVRCVETGEEEVISSW